MSQCKSCGAEITWAKTPAGKNMPLDSKGETLWLLEGGATSIRSQGPVMVAVPQRRLEVIA